MAVSVIFWPVSRIPHIAKEHLGLEFRVTDYDPTGIGGSLPNNKSDFLPIGLVTDHAMERGIIPPLHE
jgi:hypothetical protein